MGTFWEFSYHISFKERKSKKKNKQTNPFILLLYHTQPASPSFTLFLRQPTPISRNPLLCHSYRFLSSFFSLFFFFFCCFSFSLHFHIFHIYFPFSVFLSLFHPLSKKILTVNFSFFFSFNIQMLTSSSYLYVLFRYFLLSIMN